MIKFVCEGERTLVGLGISDENVKRLKEGKPILVHLDQLGLDIPLDVLIFHGRTEQEMAKALAPYIRPGTPYKASDEEDA